MLVREKKREEKALMCVTTYLHGEISFTVSLRSEKFFSTKKLDSSVCILLEHWLPHSVHRCSEHTLIQPQLKTVLQLHIRFQLHYWRGRMNVCVTNKFFSDSRMDKNKLKRLKLASTGNDALNRILDWGSIIERIIKHLWNIKTRVASRKIASQPKEHAVIWNFNKENLSWCQESSFGPEWTRVRRRNKIFHYIV